jgi:hypothetical protein
LFAGWGCYLVPILIIAPITPIMHKTLAGLVIATSLSLFSCGGTQQSTEDNKKEEEQKALFEKEYAEFKDSPRYREYESRYEDLCRLADETYLMDMLVSDKSPITDKLCFAHPYDENQNTNDKHELKKFEYVNAVIVSSQFCRGEKDMGNTFVTEMDLHQAANALNKNKFIAQCQKIDSSATYLYEQFRAAKFQMDMVNNAKYFLTLKVKEKSKWQIFANGKQQYTPGFFSATIYVYNVETKQVQHALYFTAMNSGTISGEEIAMDEYFWENMQSNIGSRMETLLDSAIGLKGNVPTFMADFN